MELAHAPARLVRQAVVADLARLDHRRHALDLLADRRPLALLRRIELGRAEHRHVPLRPVDLVEVDVVGPQPLEARFDRLGDHVARQIGAAVANPVATSGARDLGRDDERCRGAGAAASVRDTLSVRPCVVLFGGTGYISAVSMNVDAAIDREIELRVRLGLAVLLAPGHRAEADRGDAKIGAGQRAIVQGAPSCGVGRSVILSKRVDASADASLARRNRCDGRSTTTPLAKKKAARTRPCAGRRLRQPGDGAARLRAAPRRRAASAFQARNELAADLRRAKRSYEC